MSLDNPLPARQRSLQPDAPEGPKSPAWIVAEQAFALPAQAPGTSTAAVVTIRRRRAPAQAAGTEAREAGGVRSPVQQVAAPRVFRLHSAPPDGPAQVAEPARAPRAPGRRRRPVASERRPGPVAHIVVEARAKPADEVLDARVLAMRLAEVEPILDAIRAARAFRFTELPSAAEWERLSRAAERLMSRIKGRD